MPNKVTGVKVETPLTVVNLIISWKANNDIVTAYNIYRALSKEGDFVQLNADPIYSTMYVDTDATQQSHTIYWYRVTALNGVTESLPSEPVSLLLLSKIDNRTTLSRLGDSVEMKHERILREVTRRDALLLRRGGELVDLMVRKTYGIRCDRPNCYVEERDQPAQPNCAVCFGTSYKGGYDKYPGVYVKIKPITTRLELGKEGVRVFSAPTAWTGLFPIVQNGDILVRRYNNRRYKIENKEDIISRGILVRQGFIVDELLPTEDRAIYALT